MPIYGMTINEDEDGGAGFADGLPRMLTLRKGDERPASGRAPGRDLDYFRADFAEEFAHLAPVFEELYGAEPTTIPGLFLIGQTVSQVFPHWYEEWNASTLLQRCDGRNIVRWWDNERMEYRDDHQMCIKDAAKPCNCKQNGRLTFVLPELIQATGVLGTVSLNTSSVYDIIAINGYLESIYAMYGQLQGLSYTLYRAPRNVAVNINGKRSRQTKSLVGIQVTPADVTRKLLPALGVGAPPPKPALALPSESPRSEPGKALPPAAPPQDAPPPESQDPLYAHPVGTNVTATLNSVEVRKARNDSMYMYCETSEGIAISWTRRPFIDGAWIDEHEWKEVGAGMNFRGYSPAVNLTITENKESGKRIYELVEIEPLEFEDAPFPDVDDAPEEDADYSPF